MLVETLLVLGTIMVLTVGQWMVFDQTAPFFQAFDTHTKHEWIGRVTATIYTTLIAGFASVAGHTSVWGTAVALAYFLHDSLHMLMYETDITAYGHHIVSILVVGLANFVMTPIQAEHVALVSAVLESTSPVVNTTWLLNKAGYSDRPWFKYIAGFMMCFFGLMRVMIFPWIIATKMDKASMMLFSPFVAMNVYWFYKIVKLVLKKVSGTSGSGDTNMPQSHAA